MATQEFKLTLTVTVDSDDLPKGVEATKDAVVNMVLNAMEDYTENMAEDVTASGDWDSDSQAVASSRPGVTVE